ncbi:N(4)-(beta-N-acetylglucosaminyl)-L-asparaginase, partial [Autumnicola musiva]
MKRRKFITKSSLGSIAFFSSGDIFKSFAFEDETIKKTRPVCISTWNFDKANLKAGQLLNEGTGALDAVEAGVRVEESNIENTTVGIGGTPDRDGNVTLDACIMAPNGEAGSAVYLKGIEHPVSVARKVMEETPHVMLAGEGALQFALSNGFEKKNLLTKEGKEKWKEWLKEKNYQPEINVENHDTIGMLCLDKNGNIAGACTTSGLAYKIAGRIGDSPIIGSGLFVDNKIGGAVATGLGEEIMKNVSSFLIVEMMRQGKSPQKACEIALKRITDLSPDNKNFQVGLIAINKSGETGGACIHPGFMYMRHQDGKNEQVKVKSFL